MEDPEQQYYEESTIKVRLYKAKIRELLVTCEKSSTKRLIERCFNDRGFGPLQGCREFRDDKKSFVVTYANAEGESKNTSSAIVFYWNEFNQAHKEIP